MAKPTPVFLDIDLTRQDIQSLNSADAVAAFFARLGYDTENASCWIAGSKEYGARLRPDLLVGRYQPSESSLEQTLQSLRRELDEKNVSWAVTGGFAADILTHHFRGAQLCFFAQE